MLQRLAILGVLYALAQASPPMPGQTPQPSAQSSDNANRQSQGSQSSPANSLALIDVKKQAITSSNGHEEPAANDKEHSVKLTSLPPVTLTDKHKTFWDYFFDWGPWVFGFITAIAAGFQVWLLFRTWRTIGRQTDIQEAAMLQWVSVVPERIEVETESGTLTPERVTLHLYWRVVNDTSYPFTLQRIETKVARGRKEWACFGTDPNEVIPPKSENSHNFYVFSVAFKLNKRETQEFMEKGKTFTIISKVFYQQVSGKTTDQFCGDYYWCTRTEFKDASPSGYGPTEEWIEEDEHPSRIRVKEITMLDLKEVPDEPPPKPENPN